MHEQILLFDFAYSRLIFICFGSWSLSERCIHFRFKTVSLRSPYLRFFIRRKLAYIRTSGWHDLLIQFSFSITFLLVKRVFLFVLALVNAFLSFLNKTFSFTLKTRFMFLISWMSNLLNFNFFNLRWTTACKFSFLCSFDDVWDTFNLRLVFIFTHLYEVLIIVHLLWFVNSLLSRLGIRVVALIRDSWRLLHIMKRQLFEQFIGLSSCLSLILFFLLWVLIGLCTILWLQIFTWR